MSRVIPPSVAAVLPRGSVQEVLAATAEAFGCQAGTVHLMQDGALRLVAHLGLPPDVVEIVQTVPIGKGIAGLAAERREPISLCNLQTDTSGQARPAAKTTGMEGSVAVPMLMGENLRGVFGIARASAHDWTEDEKSLLLSIAAQLGEREGG